MTDAKNAAENSLKDFDWVVVSSSAGKDSQAMLDLIVEKARQADVLDRVVVVHADLGRVEWQATSQPMPEGVAEVSVPDLAAEHAKAYGLRFEIVTRPQGDLLEQIEDRGMFPGMGMTQYCTSDHKTAQIKKLFTRLVRETNEADPSTKGRRVRILDCVGLRAKESDKRSDHLLGGHWKAGEWIVKGEALAIDANGFAFEPNKRASNKTKREVVSCYPIATWSEAEVWARIGQAVTRSHWAYEAGMPRLSCCFCIYASKHALMIAGRHNPELLAEYVRVEKATGHNFHGEPGKSDSFSIASIAEALETGLEIEDEGWGNS